MRMCHFDFVSKKKLNDGSTVMHITVMLMLVTAICCFVHSAQMVSALSSVLNYLSFTEISNVVVNIILSVCGELLVSVGLVIVAITMMFNCTQGRIQYKLLLIPIGYIVSFFGDIIMGVDFDLLVTVITIALWAFYILPFFKNFKTLPMVNNNVLAGIAGVLLLICVISDVAGDSSLLYIITTAMQYLVIISFGVFVTKHMKFDEVATGQDDSDFELTRFDGVEITKGDENTGTEQASVNGDLDEEDDIIQRLRQFKMLYDEGILTDEEFELKKQQLLKNNR